MGKRGPPRTPTPILKLHGSHRAKSREGVEPRPAASRPKSQTTMSSREKRVYTQVCDWLKHMGLQASTDGNAIGRYAKMIVRYNDCCNYLAQHGDTYPILGKNPDGSKRVIAVKRWPQSIMRNELETSLLRVEREFGLTPAARASLHVDKPRAEESLEQRYFG